MADVAKGNEELRYEIHNSTERVVEALVHHRHTDTDAALFSPGLSTARLDYSSRGSCHRCAGSTPTMLPCPWWCRAE